MGDILSTALKLTEEKKIAELKEESDE